MIHIDGPQGHMRKNLSGNSSYESFVPVSLEKIVPLELDDRTTLALTACSRKMGELRGMARFLPNADMYLTMYVRKEALLSSQIEGTQCTLDDVLDPEGAVREEEVADVVRYVGATDYAVEEMNRTPISKRLLKNVHRRLLQGVRGSDKEPGELRHSQNWIGPGGSTISNAPYIPPNPEDMMDALSDLETFINSDTGIDPIVKAALVHYQFETVHPFLDGNGRLGRLLITLCLIDWGVLDAPVFYPSYQLKLRRSEYYEHLMDVRINGRYQEWVRFFCEAMESAANDSLTSMGRLVDLHARDTAAIDSGGTVGGPNAHLFLSALEETPIVTVSSVMKRLGIGRTTASNLVNRFCELGILRLRDEGKKRYRSFVYENYLAILREGSEPL